MKVKNNKEQKINKRDPPPPPRKDREKKRERKRKKVSNVQRGKVRKRD